MAPAMAAARVGELVTAAAAAAARGGAPAADFGELERGLLLLLGELHVAYSGAAFQAEVRRVHEQAGGNPTRLLVTLGAVAGDVQDPVFARLGLPVGPRGVTLMKAAAKVVADKSPQVKQLAGDLRELLGLEREEAPRTTPEELAWKGRAAKYRGCLQQRLEEARRRATPAGSRGAEPPLDGGRWRPLGIRTFFPAQDEAVSQKAPMGRPPDLLPGRPAPGWPFASPEAVVTDRYEMSLWLSRSLSAFGPALGDEASRLLFEADPRLAAEPQAPQGLRSIYVAGVEGTGHHGLGPMLLYPAVCRYGPGTLAWWRSLREVLFKTPPCARRERLEKLLQAMGVDDQPHVLVESASYPFGEEGRARWARGCDDPDAVARERASGNPGNSADLLEFCALLAGHGEVRVLALHRGLAAAAWSHKEWDDGLVEHAKILALFCEYLTEALGSLSADSWRWVAYEDLCDAHRRGDFAAMDPVADFLGLDREALRRSFRCFRPSTKDAAAEMGAESLAAIRALELERGGSWFPARFPEQQLLARAGAGDAAPCATPAEDASHNQKLAMLLESMDEEQLAAWRDVDAPGAAPEESRAAALQRLESLLSEDQRFFLRGSLKTEKVLQTLQGASIDPKAHTCVHVWIEGRGIGSEVNNLISAAVFCERHGLDCVVEDEGWNAGRWGDYLDAAPVVHSRCPRADGCRRLEVRRSKQVATSGWFAVCKHALGVPLVAKAECTRRLWRLAPRAREAVASLNAELGLPEVYLAVHMRRGDKVFQPSGQKGNEAWPIQPSTYAQRALAHLAPPMAAIAVCSDDVSASEAFAAEVARARPDIQVCWRPRLGAPEALRTGHWQQAWNAQPPEERRALTHEFLADIEVMRGAHTLVCTHSSNVGRLVAQLRDGPTHSLDEAWTNS